MASRVEYGTKIYILEATENQETITDPDFDLRDAIDEEHLRYFKREIKTNETT